MGNKFKIAGLVLAGVSGIVNIAATYFDQKRQEQELEEKVNKAIEAKLSKEES